MFETSDNKKKGEQNMFKEKLDYDNYGCFYGPLQILTPEEKEEREALLLEKSNYVLKIGTNMPVKAYVRELIAYSLGILDDYGMSCYFSIKGCSPIGRYFRKFWKEELCEDYGEYLRKHGAGSRPDKYSKFYERELHPTWQPLYNHEQATFYRTDMKIDGGKSVYVQFRTPEFADTSVGRKFLNQVRKFFENGYALDLTRRKAEPLSDEPDAGLEEGKPETVPELLCLDLIDKCGQVVAEFPVDSREADEAEAAWKTSVFEKMQTLSIKQMAYLLTDITSSPEKYPDNADDWMLWLHAEGGEYIKDL